MKSTILHFVHLLVLIVKAVRPGGVKAIIAENVLLRHQLALLSRSRRKAPNLQTRDRLLFGVLSLLISPRRLSTVAIIIKPATLLKFHRALIKRKYRSLFSN
jgi:putative transposase